MRRTWSIAVVIGVVILGGAIASAHASSSDADLGAAGAASRAHRKVIFATRARWRAQAQRTSASATSPAGSGDLQFGGGIDGIGVTTGPPSVDLVVWGSQWGAQSVDEHGDLQLASDAAGLVPRLQEFLRGLGTNGERWSAIDTQYCEGVAAGATSCPASAAHVVAPSGGVLRGVWADEAAAAPAQATDDQLASEAVAAAQHFGNTTPVANRLTQYLVVSPSGTHPGGFGTPSGDFCSWHAAASSPYGDLSFTNLPYVTDAGASCGAGYVHNGAAGALDGVTIVEGHEFSETVTDQVPPGGWTDAAGYEVADKCAWIGVGGSGGAQDLSLTTGAFPVAGLWSNATGACAISGENVVGTSPSVLTVVGASETAAMTAKLVGGGAVDVPSQLTDPLVVPGDAFCSTLTFGPGGVAPPANSGDGLDALAATLDGTYPDPTSDVGRGCVDIVRTTIGPRG